MAAPARQRSVELPAGETQSGKRPTGASRRRRARLRRGPLTIGEPAPRVDPRLAVADPYRPETIADGGDAFGLTVRAASVRGLSKRYTGGPRQDDLCLHVHDATRTLIVAAADGVSAAARSHLGAALAVRHAVAAVTRQLDGGAHGIDWPEVFEHAAWALVDQARRDRADTTVHEAAAALATTLVVAAITADEECRLDVAAVGDSPAFVLAERRFEALVGETDRGEGLIGGGVNALPRHNQPVCAAARSLAAHSVLLVCTDGLALPLADGTGEVGRTLARELARPPDIVDFARLLDFSRSTYDDDRTLIAVWRDRTR